MAVNQVEYPATGKFTIHDVDATLGAIRSILTLAGTPPTLPDPPSPRASDSAPWPLMDLATSRIRATAPVPVMLKQTLNTQTRNLLVWRNHRAEKIAKLASGGRTTMANRELITTQNRTDKTATARGS